MAVTLFFMCYFLMLSVALTPLIISGSYTRGEKIDQVGRVIRNPESEDRSDS